MLVRTVCHFFVIISRASLYVAVLSFLGAFLLIRYKLKEATHEEMVAEGLVDSPLVFEVGAQPTMRKAANDGTAPSTQGPKARNGTYAVEPPIISANPHLEQVGPFRSSVSSHLLSRAHGLCVFLAAIGFVLAIIGIVCYAWASYPLSISIFTSTCLGTAVLAMVVLFI